MMSSPSQIQTAAVPSVSQLARTTVIALAVAAVLLVTLVLPAEYAIDPLGTGRALGLTEIAAPVVAVVEGLAPVDGALRPTVTGPVGTYPAEFKFDVFELVLPPYEYIEYKYQLEQGAAMQYSWAATSPLMQDFHGERIGGEDGPKEESYDKQDRRQANGAFTAPFTGIHGWYWENPGGQPITIRLTTSGFYSAAVEIRSDRTRHRHDPRSLATLPAAPAVTAPGER
jgi:hypothetical protein